MLEQISLNIGF